MNKKILSLAIAAAVAAPMAAQAEVKISGSVARDMYNETGKNLVGGDSGTSKLNIDASEGDAMLRMAWDIRPAATKNPAALMPAREQEAGVKVGGATIKIGRQANAYAGAMTIDAMNATFLEARNTIGGTSKVASFVSGLLGVSMKAGDVALNVQYGPSYKDMYTMTNPVIAGVTFKAGPVDLGIGYEQQSNNANATNAGVRAKMKFGGVNVAVSLKNASNSSTSGAASNYGTAHTQTESIVFADVGMDLGGMAVGLGVGSNSTTNKTFTRLSVKKQMGKASVYAGVSNDGNSKQRAGAGLRVDM